MKRDQMTSALIAAVTKRLGLPQPVELRRGRRFPDGPIALASMGGTLVADTLEVIGLASRPALTEDGAETPAGSQPPRLGALVIDATLAATVADLEACRRALRPAVRGLERSGRIVIVGLDPASVSDVQSAAVQQALEGIVRSVGKELRGGATANLVRVEGSGPQDLASTLAFLLQGRSAYVNGQPITLGVATPAPGQPVGPDSPPFAGRVVVVTGAARGIGAAIAETFAALGATLVAVDVPGAGEQLAAVANRLGGTALQLDVTAPEAGRQLAEHVATRHAAQIHTLVHNAGITRDKLLANLDAERWASVLEVNLASQLRINETLLDPAVAGGLADHGRIVSLASTSGIAGNRGQSNYAASKAGVIGLVRALAPAVAERGITVNAVAPGFIETEMTGKIPLATREVGRRINSLHQGGRPVDVAETIAWLADPASGAVRGQVVRVCGQSQLGA